MIAPMRGGKKQITHGIKIYETITLWLRHFMAEEEVTIVTS